MHSRHVEQRIYRPRYVATVAQKDLEKKATSSARRPRGVDGEAHHLQHLLLQLREDANKRL